MNFLKLIKILEKLLNIKIKQFFYQKMNYKKIRIINHNAKSVVKIDVYII
jgi:hypothetical protein